MTTTTLNFDLFARDRTASATFNKFGSNVDRSNRAVKTLRVGVASLAKAFVALAVIQKTTEFVSDSIDEAREANKVGRQTEAVIKSTGGAAKVTAKQVAELSNQISLKAGIDDEAIQSGANLLLTFRNVRNEVGKGNKIFDQALAVTTDMSVALGKDMTSSTIMVGKALNDPIKGLTALGRAGVQFSEDQKKRIKGWVEEGKTMRAQKAILKELNTQFKGSAAAQADPADKARVAWENFKESIGLKLMPVLNRLLIWFTAEALPAIQRFGSWLSSKIGPAVDWLREAFSGARSEGDGMTQAFARIVASGQQVYNALRPIAIDIANYVRQNWPAIKATVTDVMNSIASTISAVAATITALWDRFGSGILRIASIQFKQLATSIKGALRIIEGIFNVFAGVLTGDWSRAWKGLGQIVGGAKDIVVGKVREFVSMIRNALSPVVNFVGDAFRSAFRNGLNAVRTGGASIIRWHWELPRKILAALGNLDNLLYQAGAAVMQGFIDGILSKWHVLQNTLQAITSMIPDLKGPLDKDKVLLEPAGKAIMDGLINGLESRLGRLRDKLRSITDEMRSFNDGFASSFSAPSVFGVDTGDAPVSMASIMSGALKRSRQARMDRKDVAKLIKMGLSNDLIREMADAGESGRAQLRMLASQGSVADIRRLNSLSASTVHNVNRAAGAASRELYGDKRRNRLENVEDMERAMRRALRAEGVGKIQLDSKDIHQGLRGLKRSRGNGELGLA